MNVIKVTNGEFSVNLPTKNNTIRLDSVKTFFPNASTLTYLQNNERTGILVENGELQIVPGISKYDVFCANSPKKSNFSATEQNRVAEILVLINSENEELENKSKINKAVPKTIMRRLFIGWKHKASTDDAYHLIKSPVGGIRSIELDCNKNYDIDYIKNAAIAAMSNELNECYFEESNVNLGSYDNVIYNNFKTEGESKCNFWNFAAKLKGKNRQMKIYLLTTKKVKVDKSTDAFKDHFFQVPGTSMNENSQISFNKEIIDAKFQASTLNDVTNFDNLYSRKFSAKSESKSIKMIANQQSEEYSCSSLLKSIKSTVSVRFIGREEITLFSQELGRGAFGCVNRANWLGTDVAVKVLKRGNNDKYIIREIQMLDKIRHPNVVSIMAVSMDPFNCFIVMELFTSKTLRYILFQEETKRKYNLNKEKRLYIGVQICTAITFLHDLNPCIVHKDIKPENILVDKHCVTKICDLGLSKCSDIAPELRTTIGKKLQRNSILYGTRNFNIESTSISEIRCLGFGVCPYRIIL